MITRSFWNHTPSEEVLDAVGGDIVNHQAYNFSLFVQYVFSLTSIFLSAFHHQTTFFPGSNGNTTETSPSGLARKSILFFANIPKVCSR
jgi:hypothetical protein